MLLMRYINSETKLLSSAFSYDTLCLVNDYDDHLFQLSPEIVSEATMTMMIGRRYNLLYLSFCLTVVCFRGVVGPTCDPLFFTDIPSKTYKADLVLDATAYKVPEREDSEQEDEEHPVQFLVNRVLKGSLERGPKSEKLLEISVGMFSSNPDPNRCVAPLPPVGSRYILFLHSSTGPSVSDVSDDGNSPSGGAAIASDSTVFLISSLPVDFSYTVRNAVKDSSKPTYAVTPWLTMNSTDVYLWPGATLRLYCIAKGNPRPTAIWYQNENPLPTTERVVNLDTKNGFILLVRNVNSDDSGIYKCQAANVVGRTPLMSINGVAVKVLTSSAHSEPCEQQDYCFHGGTCMILVMDPNHMYCHCAEGFTEQRCQTRDADILL